VRRCGRCRPWGIAAGFVAVFVSLLGVLPWQDPVATAFVTKWWFRPATVLTAYTILIGAAVWNRWKVKTGTLRSQKLQHRFPVPELWAAYHVDGRTVHFLCRIEAADRDTALQMAYQRFPSEHHAHIMVVRWEGPEKAA
jgi:hypothetical protein